ncbi:hypothetical protein FRACYDRAFT_222001 [Fragilariopsis cylindrus CCMP1102]|uniref:Uncharacterized protein n=1 Tax=Fragilariopsis cylindrus CCMP1102 TaxID=635003 RepID=A0A1E7EL22_9STRA|nr:hypothetical protein FRACYDRAFT_222001 [Fragilariopsis cylindrus CCMP1102]|eukprot:OEU06612.1 hypothetical protein FRACYDRAFT_222001 [Fragilariopsis cylindrus CCMP1102]
MGLEIIFPPLLRCCCVPAEEEEEEEELVIIALGVFTIAKYLITAKQKVAQNSVI